MLLYLGLDVHKNSIVMAIADGDFSPVSQVVQLAWSEPDVLKGLY